MLLRLWVLKILCLSASYHLMIDNNFLKGSRVEGVGLCKLTWVLRNKGRPTGPLQSRLGNCSDLLVYTWITPLWQWVLPNNAPYKRGRKKEQLTNKIRLASSLNNSDLEEGWAQKEKIWKVYFRLRISNATTFVCVCCCLIDMTASPHYYGKYRVGGNYYLNMNGSRSGHSLHWPFFDKV